MQRNPVNGKITTTFELGSAEVSSLGYGDIPSQLVLAEALSTPSLYLACETALREVFNDDYYLGVIRSLEVVVKVRRTS